MPQQVLTNSFVISKLPTDHHISIGMDGEGPLTRDDKRLLKPENDMRSLNPENDKRSLKKKDTKGTGHADQLQAGDSVDRDSTNHGEPLRDEEVLASQHTTEDSPATRIKKVILRVGGNPSESLEGGKVTGVKTISNKDKGRRTLPVNKSLQHDVSKEAGRSGQVQNQADDISDDVMKTRNLHGATHSQTVTNADVSDC